MKSKLLLLALAGTALTGLATAGETVKIAYAYTSSVSNYHGGDDNTKSKINSKHGKITDIHSNSATGVTFVKGPSYKATAYTATNVTSLQAINNLISHANLRGARDTRDSSNSDLLQLVCDWTDANFYGRGQQPGWASVIRKQTLGGTDDLSIIISGHETGHNLNADHAKSFCTLARKSTVMATGDNACPAGYNFINFFSSSTQRLNYGFGGIIPLGNSTHNNRERVISQAPTTARYQ
jgi:hypothetical protein